MKNLTSQCCLPAPTHAPTGIAKGKIPAPLELRLPLEQGAFDLSTRISI
jgi:hypothetical protein